MVCYQTVLGCASHPDYHTSFKPEDARSYHLQSEHSNWPLCAAQSVCKQLCAVHTEHGMEPLDLASMQQRQALVHIHTYAAEQRRGNCQVPLCDV